MMIFTDDPVSDFHRHDAEQEKKIEKLSVCDYCDEHIQDEYAYYINGEWICECCLGRHFRKDMVDYVG